MRSRHPTTYHYGTTSLVSMPLIPSGAEVYREITQHQVERSASVGIHPVFVHRHPLSGPHVDLEQIVIKLAKLPSDSIILYSTKSQSSIHVQFVFYHPLISARELTDPIPTWKQALKQIREVDPLLDLALSLEDNALAPNDYFGV
jgi:hypothetical protein